MLELEDRDGHRKYLTPGEREAFLKAAESMDREVQTFCGTLVHTGCRISEALALTADRVDMTARRLVFRSLKKRKQDVYRRVPVPPEFLKTLDLVHDIRAAKKRSDGGKRVLLWEWSRPTAWRRVRDVMKAAGIEGAHAMPKGLRHGFGVNGSVNNVPLDKLQKWLGHSKLETTAIYTDAMGAEEDQIAARMWKHGAGR